MQLKPNSKLNSTNSMDIKQLNEDQCDKENQEESEQNFNYLHTTPR